MDAPDVWVAKDDETEIIRAHEIAAVNLDYDGNVTARLAGRLAAPCISFRPFQGSTQPNGPRRKPGRTPDATTRYLLRR